MDGFRNCLWPTRSIHVKLLIFFSVVALIPVLTFGWLSYEKSSSLIRSQLGDYSSYAVNQLQQQLDSNLTRMEYLANDIVAYLSNSVIPFPNQSPATLLQYSISTNLTRFLMNYSPNEWGVVITGSGVVYGNNRLNYERLTQQPWWQESTRYTKGRIWVGFHPASYYNGVEADRNLIGLVAPVNENFNVPNGSAILVEMDADPILQLFRAFEEDTRSRLIITDEYGHVIYETNGGFEPRPDDQLWSKRLTTNGWNIEARMPKERFFESANVIRGYMLVTAAGSLLIALFCAELFSSSITKRVHRLSHAMHEAGRGIFTARSVDRSKDELGVLSLRFNQMIQKISNLIEDIGRIERQKKDAEMRLLHYQINPHVLLNTLNTIQWKAKLTGQKEIGKMLFHLIAILEESLNFKQEIVPLKRELEMVHHFLAVQRFRFGDVFEYTDHIDAKLLHCGIPRMTIQPLLENTFFHGFEDGKGSIHLQASGNEAGDVVLTLTDNGKGMTKGRIDSLMRVKPEGLRGGHGLYNADQKIKLHFGGKYGLTIQSAANQGSSITIKIPFQRRVT